MRSYVFMCFRKSSLFYKNDVLLLFSHFTLCVLWSVEQTLNRIRGSENEWTFNSLHCACRDITAKSKIWDRKKNSYRFYKSRAVILWSTLLTEWVPGSLWNNQRGILVSCLNTLPFAKANTQMMAYDICNKFLRSWRHTILERKLLQMTSNIHLLSKKKKSCP